MDAAVVELFAGTIEVQYGQAYIELSGQFDGNMETSFAGQSNGLIGAARPEILFLITGLHTGPVGLTINLHKQHPALDEHWEEIVEVSFQAPVGEIGLLEWAAEHGTIFPLPAGSYRARYSGQQLDAANEININVEDTPVDYYQLDLWPAPQAPDAIIEQTAAVAAYWHNWAGTLQTDRRP